MINTTRDLRARASNAPTRSPRTGVRRWTRAACVSVWCVVLVSCSSTSQAQQPAVPSTVPGPSASVPDDVSPTVEAELNELLVGVDVDVATERLEAAGWTVRVYDADDPSATLTADFSDARVTVGESDGRVAAVAIG